MLPSPHPSDNESPLWPPFSDAHVEFPPESGKQKSTFACAKLQKIQEPDLVIRVQDSGRPSRTASGALGCLPLIYF